MTANRPDAVPLSPREIVLATTARAVLAAFRGPLENRRLSAPATATLRLLESALDAYRIDLPPAPAPPSS